ncbi:phosphoserine phosphatase SerB [Thecamonas trahens ATCC 50062]|uniref:phosphoserine phosphatase n=1 Tax=Thecamonas trahens ATCC 50062 TaxID=461836 RepID=A0A0L0D4Y7_THETB|nr:phosphoserine phosphatase SerB [Thecamonas trahens ATCC 50062]KNC47437.1 phosphoserine phosphatase SerB [Thecamonas trahens ATCC 50062]|eukprot:XP_013759374.1 phosphoserine phosphatase SerB [Thecamonas trahens ATCC 50062]
MLTASMATIRVGESRATEATSAVARPADADAAANVFASVKCVAFDVDSTVSTEEGIDVLAAALGKGDEVAAWTNKAMGGDVTFQEAIKARLDILKPTKGAIDNLVKTSPIPITPEMPELIAALQARGTAVVFVSGGLLPLVRPVADALNVDDVFAIDLYFDDLGGFLDFDRRAPTARTNGKADVLHALRSIHGSVAMVGDGVTDLEAACEADVMVGFGANVVREPVKSGCDWWVTSARELIDALSKSE